MKKLIIILSILLFAKASAIADEGMWIPLLLKQTKYEDMVSKGLNLSYEDIYNINSASLKDAVGMFGGGCTFGVVSDNGLIITNHHCGYGAIQELSTIENDILTDGFWAKNKEEEIPAKNLKVSFLISMEDVTEDVFKGINENMTEDERDKIIKSEIKKITEKSIKGTHYNADVKPLYNGNQYFLYITETFNDIRLVGTPPSSIGKFGGDTDNWVWPRHTGDFSVFRIYADTLNLPSNFSENNIPYKPRKHLKISLKGVKEGDFTMVYGYPFYTYEYLPSYAVELLTEVENPIKIKIRRTKMDAMEEGMNRDKKIRIQYSSKQASLANGWKKWIGQNAGLKANMAINKKRELENKFQLWADADAKRQKKYSGILTRYKEIYRKMSDINRKENFYREAFWSGDVFRFTEKYISLNPTNKNNISQIKKESDKFFNDFNKEIERKIFEDMIRLCYDTTLLHPNAIPEIIKILYIKHRGNIAKITANVFDKSLLINQNTLQYLVNKKNEKLIKTIKKDPLCEFVKGINDNKFKIAEIKLKFNKQLDSLNRLYMMGLMEMQTEKLFYPDANATLRIAYGKVEGLKPRDAVKYDYITTIDGIIEKDNPDIYDYDVPKRLKSLSETKDFGNYSVNGILPVCFLASNHTSGGNSGSPVLNGNGELIGINFDRNWEGTMSDIMYDGKICRNICLDIRYCLFIIDKFANAKNIINEMTLIY